MRTMPTNSLSKIATQHSLEIIAALKAEIERLRARLHEIESQAIASTDPHYVAVPAKLIYEQKP